MATTCLVLDKKTYVALKVPHQNKIQIYRWSDSLQLYVPVMRNLTIYKPIARRWEQFVTNSAKVFDAFPFWFQIQQSAALGGDFWENDENSVMKLFALDYDIKKKEFIKNKQIVQRYPIGKCLVINNAKDFNHYISSLIDQLLAPTWDPKIQIITKGKPKPKHRSNDFMHMVNTVRLGAIKDEQLQRRARIFRPRYNSDTREEQLAKILNVPVQTILAKQIKISQKPMFLEVENEKWRLIRAKDQKDRKDQKKEKISSPLVEHVLPRKISSPLVEHVLPRKINHVGFAIELQHGSYMVTFYDVFNKHTKKAIHWIPTKPVNARYVKKLPSKVYPDKIRETLLYSKINPKEPSYITFVQQGSNAENVIKF